MSSPPTTALTMRGLSNYHLLTTSNTTGATTRTYAYVYNDKDQRTKLTLADGSYWEYTYDDKGQVTSGVKKDSAGKAIPGQSFGYSYDGIGNMLYKENGMSELKIEYSTNSVNQYTGITYPGIIPVIGEADSDAEVKAIRNDTTLIYGQRILAPTRDGKYYKGVFRVNNTISDKTVDYSVYAMKDDPNNPGKKLYQKEDASFTVPKKAQTYTYDTDGNVTGMPELGITLIWNGENRLIEGQSPAGKVEYAYDYMGRRISKKVYAGTPGNWTLSSHHKFVYDGFKQIAEFDGMNSDALARSYTWQPVELDVPLWVKDSSTYYYYIADGNKNVRAMIDVSGNEVAQYDYNPFGKIVASSGAYKNINPYRFSSEYYDAETGLIYYNYRYYYPEAGRWLSRDPIGTKGGYNLYGFVNNNPISWWDVHGQKPWVYFDSEGRFTLDGPFWDWVSDAAFSAGDVIFTDGVVNTVTDATKKGWNAFADWYTTYDYRSFKKAISELQRKRKVVYPCPDFGPKMGPDTRGIFRLDLSNPIYIFKPPPLDSVLDFLAEDVIGPLSAAGGGPGSGNDMEELEILQLKISNSAKYNRNDKTKDIVIINPNTTVISGVVNGTLAINNLHHYYTKVKQNYRLKIRLNKECNCFDIFQEGGYYPFTDKGQVELLQKVV